MSTQVFHVHEIETPTPGGGKHTRFIYEYDQTVDQCNQLMTVLESNNRNIKKLDKAVKKVKSNNDLIVNLVPSLVPSLDEIIRGGMSSDIYVRNGWSGV